MNEAKIFVKNNPSASFFTYVFVSVLSFHVFARKYALLKFKIDAVLTKHFGEKLAFNLLYKLIDGIAKSEISLVCWMGMKVEVHEQSFIFIVMFTQLANGKARRLFFWIWGRIISIEVLVKRVHATMPPGNSIRVEHRDKHKHKILAKKVCSGILFIEEEVNDSGHCEARGCFDGVHPCRYEYNWLIISIFDYFLIAKGHAFCHLEALPAFV